MHKNSNQVKMGKNMCFGGNWEKANLSSSKEETFTDKGRQSLMGRIGNIMGLEVLVRDGVLAN